MYSVGQFLPHCGIDAKQLSFGLANEALLTHDTWLLNNGALLLN